MTNSKSTSVTIECEDGSRITYGSPYFVWVENGSNGRLWCNCSMLDAMVGTSCLVADFIHEAEPTFRKRKRRALVTAYLMYKSFVAYLRCKEEEK